MGGPPIPVQESIEWQLAVPADTLVRISCSSSVRLFAPCSLIFFRTASTRSVRSQSCRADWRITGLRNALASLPALAGTMRSRSGSSRQPNPQ